MVFKSNIKAEFYCDAESSIEKWDQIWRAVSSCQVSPADLDHIFRLQQPSYLIMIQNVFQKFVYSWEQCQCILYLYHVNIARIYNAPCFCQQSLLRWVNSVLFLFFLSRVTVIDVIFSDAFTCRLMAYNYIILYLVSAPGDRWRVLRIISWSSFFTSTQLSYTTTMLFSATDIYLFTRHCSTQCLVTKRVNQT